MKKEIELAELLKNLNGLSQEELENAENELNFLLAYRRLAGEDKPQKANRKGEQVEASPAEQEQRKAAMKTQGRKGCKAVRIHMAFSPANHTFIESVAAASGATLTQVTNKILDEYRAAHPEVEARAKRYLAKQFNELGIDFNAPFGEQRRNKRK